MMSSRTKLQVSPGHPLLYLLGRRFVLFVEGVMILALTIEQAKHK